MSRPYLSFLLILATSAQAALDSFSENSSNNEVLTSSMDFTWGRISQKMDHFNRSSVKNFNQRYLFVNQTKGRNYDAPVFIVVGGQHEIDETALWNSYPVDIAQSHNGCLFILEHRYYGKSMPVDELSIENLHWLNIEQALADISVFVDFVRNNIINNRRAKIVLVGSRYGGTLAVWFHQLYAGKVSAVWASSAPLLAKVENEDVLKLAGQVYRDVGGDECYERIRHGFELAEQLHANKSFDELAEKYAICDPKNPDGDIRLFFSTYATLLSRLPQFRGITEVCAMLKNSTRDDALSLYIRGIGQNANQRCFNVDRLTFIDFLRSSKPTDYAVLSGARQILYQECSGFGWFASTSSKNQPFGSSLPVEMFYESCFLAFGNELNRGRIDERAETLNAIFGGLQPGIRRVVFTNGDMDPWRMLSVQSEYNNECVVLNIAGEGSSSDMYSISSRDSAQLTEAKLKIKSVLSGFLKKI